MISISPVKCDGTVMQRRLIRLSCLLAFYILCTSVSAQDRSDQNWWMGNGANGIQFSQPDDSARIITRPTAEVTGYGDAGGAVANDPASGALLFYTDGVDVFDRTHRLMLNGALLQGSKSGNQPAVVGLVPGSSNRYFILTNTATSSTPGLIFYHEVDLDQFGHSLFPGPPLGDVTVRDQATDVVNASEGMILVPNQARDGYWLITHLPASATFHVTPVTTTGVGATTDYTPTVPFTFTASHIAYDSVQKKLAVAPIEANRSITTYNFDNVTGEITFDQVVFNSAFTGALAAGDYAFYDVAWSNTGNYLYASRQNELVQFDMVTANVLPVTIATVFQSYGLQLAPDSSIYHVYQTAGGGPFLIGRITDPDTVGTASNYEALPFGNINFGARQFPAFLPRTKLNLTADFDFVGSCQNAPVSFFPTVTPGADSLRWSFGDAANGVSTVWAPVYTYAESGTFTVKLTAYLAGDSTEMEHDVVIDAFDIQLTLVQDTTACSCELNFPENPPPSPPVYSDGEPCTSFMVEAKSQQSPSEIQWYGPSGLLAGQTSLILSSVDSAGYYYVIAGNGSGCATYAGVNIKEYGAEDQRANMWVFGQQAGIDFNNLDVGPIAFNAPYFDSPEGTSVISDQNGQIIVSTDGNRVYDRAGTLVGEIGGSSDATQSALIVPFPSDPTLYYIFVTQEVYPTAPSNYELRYAVFDLKILPLGGLKPLNAAGDVFSNVLFTKNTERITGNQNWLIAHEYGNNNFRAYPLTAEGIGNPVLSSIGSDHSLAVAEHAQGYMELGQNGILAVALSTPGVSNVVEIFDFDTTGTVTNFRTIDLEQADGQVYGLEFSPGNQKLFVSTKGGTSMLHEFVYDSAVGTYIQKFAPINPGAEIGAIQAGPNGTIYVAAKDSPVLKTIMPNEDEDIASTLGPDFNLNGATSTLGLPNFIQNLNNAINQPGITVSNSCEDQEVTFTGNGTDVIDTLTWQIRDAANTLLHSERGVNLTEIVYTFEEPGKYSIRLIVTNRCVGLINTIDSLITINRVPTLLPDNAVLCDGGIDSELTAVDPADPDIAKLTFLWISGETTNTITPTSGGTYSVTVTTADGCDATRDDYVVTDNRPQVELGPDQIVCENSGPIAFDASNAGSTYQWTSNGTDVTPTAPADPQFFSQSTSDPGQFDIALTITNTFGCTITDAVSITVNPDAQADGLPTHPTCGNADGAVEIVVNTTGTYFYSLSGPSTATGGNVDVVAPPTSAATVNGLRSGAYNMLVTNQVTGCFDSETIALSDQDAGFTVTIASADVCNEENEEMPIQITTDAPQPYTYSIFVFTTTNEVANGSVPPMTNETEPVPNGRYVAEITDANGCVVVSDDAMIEEEEEVAVDNVVVTDCDDPIIITVQAAQAGGFVWTWDAPTDPEEVSSAGQTQLQHPDLAPGIYTYGLTLQGNGTTSCDNDTTFTVRIDEQANFTIPENLCSDIVTLTASPSGGYVYSWELDGAPVAGGEQLFATSSGTYTLTVRGLESGCESTFSDDVTIIGNFVVDLMSTQACQGTDFMLTATPDPWNPADNINFVWFYSEQTSPTKFVVEPDQTNNEFTVTDDRSGYYKIEVTKTAGPSTCTTKDSLAIAVSPITPGALPNTGIICPDPDLGTTVTLDAGPGFLSYQWFMNGSAEEDDTLQTYTAYDVGTYRVDLINAFGCPSSDETELIDECDPRITGPNAFRPSGLNNEFSLFTFFIADEDFEIFIYNRWGEMVYYSKDRAFKWNGGYKNDASQAVPPGTYTYLIKYKSSYKPEQGIKEYRNGVVLLR